MFLERVIDSIENNDAGISVHRYGLKNLRFTDYIDLREERRSTLEAKYQEPKHTYGRNDSWIEDQHWQDEDIGVWQQAVS